MERGAVAPVTHHSPRPFFGLAVSDEARQVLAALVPPRSTPGAGAFKWVDPSLYHLTLAFLGNTPSSALPRLHELGQRVAAGAAPFTLTLSQPGSFGSRGGGAALWVGLAGELDALAALQSTLVASLRDALFDFDAKPFRPHITLARRRRDARQPPLTWPASRVPSAPIPVTELVLFESRLAPAGPSYHPRGAFPLGGSAG